MTSEAPAISKRSSPTRSSRARTAFRMSITKEAPYRGGLRGALLVIGGLIAVCLIALLDYGTGPHLSCSIFYLIPVAACAWWGGFSHGILLALAGSVAWHLIDILENPTIPPAAGVWNGVVRFCTLTLVSSLVSRLHTGVHRERRLARTDPLTGAANARTFYEVTENEADRARKASAPLTLAYLDVDDFKQLNDRLGHAAGDAALRHVVETIHHDLAGSGLLARLGGDEFALLLPDLEPGEALALLLRLQEQLSHEMARCGWPVTLSVGAITFLRPGTDVDLMIRRIDALMYKAKRKCKGRVEHAIEREDQQPRPGERRRAQRRATARVICGRTARVRGEDQEPTLEVPATVSDISAGGVGLSLEVPFLLDTVLVVEPLVPGARPLLARVVRVVPEGVRWLHGCALSHRLNAEELRGWLGSSQQSRSIPPEAPSQKLERMPQQSS